VENFLPGPIAAYCVKKRAKTLNTTVCKMLMGKTKMVYKLEIKLRKVWLAEEDPNKDATALVEELNTIELIKPTPIVIMYVTNDHVDGIRNIKGAIDIAKMRLVMKNKEVDANDNKLTRILVNFVKAMDKIGVKVIMRSGVIVKGLEGIKLYGNDELKYEYMNIKAYSRVTVVAEGKKITRSRKLENSVNVWNIIENYNEFYSEGLKRLEEITTDIKLMGLMYGVRKTKESIGDLTYELMDFSITLAGIIINNWTIGGDSIERIKEGIKNIEEEEKEEEEQYT